MKSSYDDYYHCCTESDRLRDGLYLIDGQKDTES